MFASTSDHAVMDKNQGVSESSNLSQPVVLNFTLTMPHIPVSTKHIVYDITRLANHRNRRFATGVDRIDLAIGLNLVAEFGDRCKFLFASQIRTTLVPQDIGRALLNHLNDNWNNSVRSKMDRVTAARLFAYMYTYLPITISPSFAREIDPDTTYVVASHSGLPKVRGGIKRLDPHGSMKRLVYIHDLIPLDTPEYQRPVSRKAFAAYLREATSKPLTIVSNSQDTDRRVRKKAAADGWPVTDYMVAMPELNVSTMAAPPIRPSVKNYIEQPQPFFIIVSTIEPRKNHLLLLNIWRDLALAGHGIRLCIVGRRGWENENIIDMLDRCEAISHLVKEFNDLGDHEVQALMRASKGLLFPSFIEGLGLPLMEAQALGVRCIASDLPVFREIAAENTSLLDPLDGIGWKKAILASAAEQQ